MINFKVHIVVGVFLVSGPLIGSGYFLVTSRLLHCGTFPSVKLDFLKEDETFPDGISAKDAFAGGNVPNGVVRLLEGAAVPQSE